MGASRKPLPQLDDSWMKKGTCRVKKINLDTFFPPEDDQQERAIVKHAREVACGQCPVSGNCLNWALEVKEVGIWGGTTKEERDALRRIRIRAACLRCHAGFGFIRRLEDAEVCLRCGLSWLIPVLQIA